MKSGEQADQGLIHVLEMIGNAIVGGVEKYVHYLAQYLPSQGFKITCVAPYESYITARLRELGSQVYVTHMDDNPPWRSIQFLTELVRHQDIDLLHAHLPRAHVLAGLIGCLTERPVVMTVHGMEISAWELGILRTTGAYLNVVCQAAYAQALSLGVPMERVKLIPNGVDLRIYRPELDGVRFRKALNLSAAAPLVGFVGRLAYEKGPDIFIQFAEYIHRARPEVHFVMVGDGPMRAELAQQVERTDLEDYLHLAGSWDQMHEVYPAFDVLVQTSRVEGMPLSLLEAMACGVPVAAMNVGGVAEVVEVGTTGFLSALGDWAGQGDAVLKLFSDSTLRKEMGAAARKRVEEKFDLNNCLELLSREFRDLTASPSPAIGLETNPAMLPKDIKRDSPRPTKL